MGDEKSFLSTNVFDDKTIADLVRLTYDRNVKINKTIDEFLDRIKESDISPSELIALLPIIKDYLNTANNSDTILVKLIATLSRYIVDPNTNKTPEGNTENVDLTDEDRELFKRVNDLIKEDKNI